MTSSLYLSTGDLPEQLPVFPLAGALLLPRWTLPLNIFEPRYLNMIDDAMAGSKLIGMVQSTGGDKAHPSLAQIGCVGEITQFEETDDGRYAISLDGLARYRISEEIDARKPYRMVRADYADFDHDMSMQTAFETPTREMIIEALAPYAKIKDLSIDWDAVEDTSAATLVMALAANCPFDVMEKQALLEAKDFAARAQMLIQLLQLNASGPSGSGGQRLQ